MIDCIKELVTSQEYISGHILGAVVMAAGKYLIPGFWAALMYDALLAWAVWFAFTLSAVSLLDALLWLAAQRAARQAARQ